MGHFKRAIGFLYELSNKFSELEVHVICSRWQVYRLRNWDKLKCLQKKGAQFQFDHMENSTAWIQEASQWHNDKYSQWLDQLFSIRSLQTADLVLSDNLVEVLSVRSDTILMGSFLWMEVFAHRFSDNQEIASFVQNNEMLLQKTKPPMICVGEVAMSALNRYTTPIPFSWFGQEGKKEPRLTSPNHQIGVLAGATSFAKKQMESITRVLLAETKFNILIPEKSIQELDFQTHNRIQAFNFELSDFQQCDLIFCRPGIGTLTDCITTNTPMVFFYEEDNYEMAFNAQKLTEQGIAKTLSAECSNAELKILIKDIYNSDFLLHATKKMTSIPVDGFEKAANWLIDYYQH